MERFTLRHEMFKSLLDDCIKKIEREPNNMELIRARGILLNLIKKYQIAIEDFKYILNEIPNDKSSYFMKSDCHFKMGEFELAKRDFLRGLQLETDPTIPDSAIEHATIADKQELKEIEEVLEYEKNKAILAYLPQIVEC